MIEGRWEIENNFIGPCGACGVIRTAHVPAYYSSLYTEGLRYHGEVFKERFEHDLKLAEKRLEIYKNYYTGVSGGSLMDVGCANGAFLAHAKRLGFHVEGIEANPEMARWVYLNHGLQIYPAWPEGPRYNIVTYHDTIEHFTNPFQELQRARHKMFVDGLLVVDTPDADTLEGPGRHHLKPKEHLWFFNRKSLSRLLQLARFTVVGVRHPIPGKIVVYAHPTYEGV